MRRKAFKAPLIAATLLAALGLPQPSAAQNVNRFGPPFLGLIGPGSSIGLTVRDSDAGVEVESVREGSPASRAGVRADDVVVEFDGERARSAVQFTRLVRETAPGRSVRMVVTRNGSRQTLDVTPEARGADDIRFPNITLDIDPEIAGEWALEFGGAFLPRRIGATVTSLTPQLAKYFGVEQGVLVSEVTPNSPAEAAGMRAGDVITAINGEAVSAVGDVQRRIREAAAGSSLELRVMRDRKQMTFTAKMPERTRPSGRRGRPV